MNTNSPDLRQEGSITFWISRKDNPQFSNPESNIRFMLRKDIGSIFLTVLKEQEFLRVEIDNPDYGTVELLHNIRRYLDEDMMVALTWQKNVAKLYLNGELVEEAISNKEPGMIKVICPPETNDTFQFTGVPLEDVRRTVNDRHRGLLIAGNPLRLGAIHWFEDRIVFVLGSVTETHQEGNRLKLDKLVVSLVLRLDHRLPAGEISKEMEFPEILRTVAESFGMPVICARGQEPSLLHIESAWDGEIRVEAPEGHAFLLQGTVSPEQKKCAYVWAFSLDKYRTWFDSKFHQM